MAKTEYNESAMRYAINYLDQLLEMEDLVNRKVLKKIDQLMDWQQHELSKRSGGKATATGGGIGAGRGVTGVDTATEK